MNRYPYHPTGLIFREKGDGRNSFAVVDPVAAREVSFGLDWQAAYDRWLEIRRARVPVPNPIQLSWLVQEFAACHRSPNIRLCAVHDKERKLIAIALAEMGEPLATGLKEADCVAFRNVCASMSCLGPVRTERLIGRIRQAWSWAREQGWLEQACPFTVAPRDAAIRGEVVGIVASYLPEDVLAKILLVRRPVGVLDEQQIQELSRAVRRAAGRASEQARRDGRPDLIDWLSRCSLGWMRDTSIDETLFWSNSMQSMARGRIDHVSQLRQRGAKATVEPEDRR